MKALTNDDASKWIRKARVVTANQIARLEDVCTQLEDVFLCKENNFDHWKQKNLQLMCVRRDMRIW